MALDFATLSPEELLAAESAVLVTRALLEVVKTAPQGKGMVALEDIVQDKGFEHLRTMLTAAMASHPGAQKKGSAVWPATAARRRHSGAART